MEALSLVRERLRANDQETAELGQLRAQVEGYQRALSSCPVDAGASFRDCQDLSCIAPEIADTALRQECCDAPECLL
jgi:hypothetical protein